MRRSYKQKKSCEKTHTKFQNAVSAEQFFDSKKEL
jgi:hypothetical protein